MSRKRKLPVQHIDVKDWVWFGQAGHFCAAYKCLFHLHTHVGRYCVSTVGMYYPLGIPADFQKVEPEDLSANPGKYETMVFLLDKKCESPVDHSELMTKRCMTLEEANTQHMDVCKQWSTYEDS